MDNHPTIDITKAPSQFCPSPVYNCIEYCFVANDYILQNGIKAFVLISFLPDNYADGVVVTVGGQPFITATPGGLDSFSWQGTQADIASNFADMLNKNYYFGRTFINQAVLDSVSVSANEVGFVDNWVFSFPVANPPIIALLNSGADVLVRENYQLVVEVWRYLNGLRFFLVTTRSYEPNQITGELCIDIAGILQGLVSTTFPGLVAFVAPIYDEAIALEIGLRFGEIYSTGASECDTETQIFETTSSIRVINSAFQKDDEEGIKPFCYFESMENTRFLTNRPSPSELCSESFAWLWYDYSSIIAGIVVPAPTLHTLVTTTFTYSNGSNSTHEEELLGVAGVITIPAGIAQLSSVATPGLKVVSYTIAVSVFDEVIHLPVSEVFEFVIAASGFCCCHEEFYFLGEPGSFDTILFNCLREVDLDYSALEFCAYEPCEGDILQGGKEEAEAKAFDIYRTSTRFLDNYDNLNWVREFLKSPKRYWRKDGKVYKIVLLNEQTELWRKDGFLHINLEYILSFELNTQKN